jgi:hypothetical protein
MNSPHELEAIQQCPEPHDAFKPVRESFVSISKQ